MTKYKIYFAAGLLFALTFAGADLKTAKADYVTMINGEPAEVKYNESTGKLDVYRVGEDEPFAEGVSFKQDESTNNRGVLDMDDLADKASKNNVTIQDTEVKAPTRQEQGGVMDSTEEADDYSCRQVSSCGNNVIGYGSENPKDPNYALYSSTDVQEIWTVYLRNSGQYTGNDAWDQAGKDASKYLQEHPELNKATLTAEEANNLLTDLGANFQVDKNIENVSRLDLLKAIDQAGRAAEEQEPGEEEGEPWTPPETGPFVSVLDCSFTAIPAEILYSKSSRLRWNCNRADTCSISDETGVVIRSSIVTMSGEVQVTPLKTTRYFLNCSDNKSWETLVRVFSSGIQ
ncbi:MAG TPA: hypothetical protein PLN18_00790 [Candidatus Colwellbacteria bacterium]|nr:hypothetical protein [Candidatus Colwellbacteria bacterium]